MGGIDETKLDSKTLAPFGRGGTKLVLGEGDWQTEKVRNLRRSN